MLPNFMFNIVTFLYLFHCSKTKCSGCDSPIRDPVKLPCGHIVCLSCVEELKELDMPECPTVNCGQRFPRNMTADVTREKKYRIMLNV